ncbi:hypothetical protein D3C72_2242110 [compost metagenome]
MTHQGNGTPFRFGRLLDQESPREGWRDHLLDGGPVELVAPDEIIGQEQPV